MSHRPHQTLPIGLLLLASLLFKPYAMAQQAAPETLSALQQLGWQYRVLLVRSSTPKQVLELFERQQAAIDERKLIWFVLHQGQLRSNYPGSWTQHVEAQIQRLLQDSQDNHLLLIGYDSQVKSRANGLDLQGVFGQIDGMPIRQMEMLQQPSQ